MQEAAINPKFSSSPSSEDDQRCVVGLWGAGGGEALEGRKAFLLAVETTGCGWISEPLPENLSSSCHASSCTQGQTLEILSLLLIVKIFQNGATALNNQLRFKWFLAQIPCENT